MLSFLSKRILNSYHRVPLIVNNSLCFARFEGLKIAPIVMMSKRKIKNKTISNLSAKVQVSVLGNGALGNPVSVIVNTDTDTYLINCGEGVQRLFYQHRFA